jgi:hypothetical protein
MDEFTAKHAEKMQGVISGFDRLVFRGTLRVIRYAEGMKAYLIGKGIWVGDFAQHVQVVSERLKESSLAEARKLGRKIVYLASNQIDKEAPPRRRAEDHRRAAVRLDLRGALPKLRSVPQPGDKETGPGFATAQVPFSLPLLDPSAVRFHERAPSNLVSLPGANLPERAGMAGAADGGGRLEVAAPRQLFSLDRRL